MIEEKRRYDALDGIRAVACVGIVMMHVLANARYDVSGFWFDKAIPAFTHFVFLFMVVSAFGMCCGYYERVKNNQIDIVDFYKKRYAKIWPFFAALCLIDFAISPSLGSLYETFANLTLCFGLIPNAKIEVIGVGWFLGTVFAFYMLFPFFVFLLSSKKRAWFSFAISILMNYVCAVYFHVGSKSIAYSFMFFMAGGIVYLYRKKIERCRGIRIISVAVIFISLAIFFTISYSVRLLLVVNVFLLMYCIGAGENKILRSYPLRFLGDISFEVYLCHMIIYRVVEKEHMLRMTGNEYLNYFITCFMVLVGAMIFAYVGKRIIKRIMEKI